MELKFILKIRRKTVNKWDELLKDIEQDEVNIRNVAEAVITLSAVVKDIDLDHDLIIALSKRVDELGEEVKRLSVNQKSREEK